MYTLCSTEKTADQQRIFEKTFLQMLLESNYDDITISELCRRAGLSRRIFYRLFERKSDVLYALLVILSTPMVCSQIWVISLVLWAALMWTCISVLSKKD